MRTPPLREEDACQPTPPKIPDHELLSCIGKGSYGEVWLARNVVGTYRAVKIVYRDGFGTDRPFEREFKGIQRFEPISRLHESQVDILHIGRNEDYFYYVMELADDGSQGNIGQSAAPRHLRPSTSGEATTAVPWGAYVPRTLKSEKQRRGRLPVAECLEIGLALTTALAHLHKHGLVHRDVKPSNVIFVDGIPKLADIGLVTDTEETVSFVGTEGFIPPEGPGGPQADIYGLGKVLYELSTGKDRQDYPEPATHLGEFEDREQLLELRQIITKACARDPRERYRTAEEMQADLLLLKTGKSVRRTHQLEQRLRLMTRIGVGTAAVMVLGVVPYFLAINQARLARAAAIKAEANEKKAQTQADKSKQVAQFLREMLEGVGPAVALGRDTALLREILDKTAKDLSEGLAGQPEVEAELRGIIGEVYVALGEFNEAEAMQTRAVALTKKALGNDHPDVATALDHLAHAQWKQGKLEAAEKLEREALAIRRKALGNEHELVAESLNNLSSLLENQGKFDAAAQALRESLELRRKIHGNEHAQVGQSLVNLGVLQFSQGKVAEAEKALREGVTMLRKMLTDEHPEAVAGMGTLAALLTRVGKLSEAEGLLSTVIASNRKLFGPTSPEVAMAVHELAILMLFQNKPEEAEKFAQEALAIRREGHPQGHSEVAGSLVILGRALDEQGRYAEAEKLVREGVEMFKETLDGQHPNVASSMATLAVVLEHKKDFAEAEKLHREALTINQKRWGADHPDVARGMANVAKILAHQGKLADALPMAREALEVRQKSGRNDDAELAIIKSILAEVLYRLEQHPEAERIAGECLAWREQQLPDDWATFQTRTLVGATLLAQNKLAAAEPLLVSGYEGMKSREHRMPMPARFRLTQALELLGKLYDTSGRPEQAVKWRQELAKVTVTP